MRRIAIAALLLAIVAAIAWWLIGLRQGPAQAADPWAAVPADAVAVLEVPDPVAAWDHFTGTSQFWGDLEGDPGFSAVDTIMRRIGRAAATLGQGKGGSMVVAWSVPEGNRPVPLVVWPVEPSAGALQMLGLAFGKPLSPALWNGERQHIPADSALPALEVAWANGLLLAGAAQAPVEAAVKAAAAATAAAGKPGAFNKARATFSNGADAHLLMQANLAAQWLQADGQPLFPGGMAAEGWFAMDVRLRPDAMLMNGLLLPAGNGAALNALIHQQPAMPELLRALPANVAWMNWAQVDSPAAYIRNVAAGQLDETLFPAYGAWVRGIGRAGAEGATWAVLQAADPADAAAAMALRCPDGGCPATEYRDVRITRLADPQALAVLFGNPFAAFQQPLWALLGDMVVFSDTPAAMRAAIDAWTDRSSLALAPGKGDFFTRFATGAVYTWWADVPRAWPPANGPQAAIHRTLGAAMLQLSPRSDGACIATFCVQHAPTGNKTDGALWTAAMPAPLAMPPLLVDDYLSKTLQVLVQDRDHRISLISCTGKVLWQRQLDGPLLGGVNQVDRYRNAKLQLLCNTAGKVYLIDRLGRDVEGFPVALKADAAAPLSVFDYEGNKDYRILVPLVTGAVANLGPDGKPVQGWEPEKLPAPALAPVEHVRSKGKDFLVIPLRNGTVAVLDRRGAVRYAPKLRMHALQTFLGSRDAMDIGDRRLLWADSAGAVLSGSLDGHVDTLSLPASGTVSLFSPQGGSGTAILRTTASTLTGETAGKLVFTITFPDSPGARAFAVPLGNAPDAIGLALPEQDQVRLFDAAGTLWPGFPLKGAMPFSIADINRDGALELVTADARGVVTVYLLPAKP